MSRHLNGDSLNNRLDNLVWGTAHENAMDNVRNGTHRNSRKTACQRGHDFASFKPSQAQGKRRCLACNRASVEVWRAAQRGEVLDLQVVSDGRFHEQRDEWRRAASAMAA